MLLLMSGCVASAPQWYSTFSANGLTEDARITRRGDAKAKSMTLARNTAIARAKRQVADALGCATVSGQVDRIELKDGHVYLLWTGYCHNPEANGTPAWTIEYARGKTGPDGHLRVVGYVDGLTDGDGDTLQRRG